MFQRFQKCTNFQKLNHSACLGHPICQKVCKIVHILLTKNENICLLTFFLSFENFPIFFQIWKSVLINKKYIGTIFKHIIWFCITCLGFSKPLESCLKLNVSLDKLVLNVVIIQKHFHEIHNQNYWLYFLISSLVNTLPTLIR